MTLSIEKIGETRLLCRRRFAARPARLFAAHTDPDIVSRWMTGPEGWTMPVCEIDAREGGAFRYEWSDGTRSFGMTGTFRALGPPRRIVHTERWDTNDMPPNEVETIFEKDGEGTAMTMVITYASASDRDAALATGMADGMEMSYARIDGL